jgi:hypothetical protein
MRLFLPLVLVFLSFVLFASCAETTPVVDDDGSNMGTGNTSGNAGVGGSGSGTGGSAGFGGAGAGGEGGNVGGAGGTGGVDCSNAERGEGLPGDQCRDDADCQEPHRCCTSFGSAEGCGALVAFCTCT